MHCGILPDGMCVFLSLTAWFHHVYERVPFISSLLSATPSSWTLEEASRCAHFPASPSMFTASSSSLNMPSLACSLDPHGAPRCLWRWRSLASFAWFSDAHRNAFNPHFSSWGKLSCFTRMLYFLARQCFPTLIFYACACVCIIFKYTNWVFKFGMYSIFQSLKTPPFTLPK